MRDPIHDLALVLGSKKAARELLQRTTLRHVATASLDELGRLLAPGPAKRLYAAFRLSRHAVRPDKPDTITTPEEAYAHLYSYFAGQETERLVLVLCDSVFHPIHTEVVALGGVNHVAYRPADILTPAVRHRAAGVLLAHNHPSGNPEPSMSDRMMTGHLNEACELLSITFLDHLVIAGTTYRSLRPEIARKPQYPGAQDL